MEHIDERTTKVTIRISNKMHTKILDNLHHGELTTLMRAIFNSIGDKIDNGNKMEMVNFIHDNKDLLLTPVIEEKNND